MQYLLCTVIKKRLPYVDQLYDAEFAVLHEGDLVTFGHLYGEKLAPGTKVRQPDSEYTYVVSSCNNSLIMH